VSVHAVPAHPPTFWALVQARAAARPDRTILRADDGRSLTGSQFHDVCERVAAGLAGMGVKEGMVVSWQLPTILEAPVLLGALSRLGAVQNPIIPILRRREVGFIAHQTGTEMLIVPPVWRGFDYPAMAGEIAAEVGASVLVVDRDAGLGAHGVALPDGDPASLPDPPPALEPDELPVRWLYYSSGTTADPKGIRHTDHSAMAASNGMLVNFGFEPDDVYPVAWPFTHIGGVAMLTTMLTSGAQLGLLETFDPATSPQVMADMGATILGSAVPFFHAYMAAQRRHGPEPLFPKLRVGVSGGAPRPDGLHDEVKETLGGAGIMSSWGLTEFPIVTYPSFSDTQDQLARTEGVASPGVEIRVVGADGDELPPGQEGELRVKGPQMFRGYVDSSLDVDAFDDAGWFRTGDLGVVEPTGHVRITGRLKDIIIRNAENISAQEIEDALYRHPKVADVTVIGLPDARTGERACAVVQLAEGVTELTLTELADHCRAEGLAIQKVPEQLEIVEALPRNAMGKVLKQDLRARYRG
jgi:acyl-CoA synthetase (AMP-forming)/AMP-acid ligase II